MQLLMVVTVIMSGLIDSPPILKECFFLPAEAEDRNNFGFLSDDSCANSVSKKPLVLADFSLGGDPV